MNTSTDDTLPAIGQPLDGGLYAGITLDGDRLARLILLPGDGDERDHKAATAFAVEQGGVLPSRHDMLVLLKNVKSEFQTYDWYWTSEEVTGNADSAWVTAFDGGIQYWHHKSYGYRCRAVRRVAI